MIQLNSHFSYELLFPNYKVLTKEEIDLIKYLRRNGIVVDINPDNKYEMYYLAQKGIRELFSDPIFITLINIPLTIFLNLLSSYIHDKVKNGHKIKEENLILKVDEKGERLNYKYDGKQFDSKKLKVALKALEKRKKNYLKLRNIQPPNPDRPVPVYLEHKPEIVGWGKVDFNKNSQLIIEDCILTKNELYDLIEKGEYKGFSITALVKENECSICHSDYLKCEHTVGNKYDGKKCVNLLKDWRILDINLVKEPVNQSCKIFLYKK